MRTAIRSRTYMMRTMMARWRRCMMMARWRRRMMMVRRWRRCMMMVMNHRWRWRGRLNPVVILDNDTA
jgi:hypothetical protein